MWWRLFWWVVSYALSDYFRARLPAQTASGLGDFNVPTATEGRSVPIIPGGTPKCRSLNCIWYGDFAAIERTVTTGVIFKDEETIGFTYELALQYALFKGRCAGITGIWIADDKVFDHVLDNGGVPAPDFVDIDRDDLFGGVDDGGGFVGRIRLFNGSETQGVSGYLNTRITELPAYRGTCYVMVTNLAEDAGANIGEAPNLRYISVEVQAFDTVANGALGDSLNLGNDHHFIGPDANPVSVAYELLTNPRWGRAMAAGDVDLANFQAAAEVVYLEGIGYTQLVDEQTTTGEIQDTLEQHMDAYIGPDPINGKMQIKLARFDYTLAAEFQADQSNVVAVPRWNKGDWSQTYNRVRLRYSDRAKDWNETHAVAVAAGNRIIQGKTATKEIRYQGVHSANVANLIAARDLRNLAQPTSSGTIHLDRTAYELRPGDVFSFTSPDVGETELAVRITKSGVGNTIKNTMEFEVTADVFDTEIPNVADPPPTDFIPPIQGVIPFDALDQAATESPHFLMRMNPLPNLIPRITTFARRTGAAPIEYEVIRRVSAGVPAGAYTSTDFVSAGFMSVGLLRNNELGWQSGNGGFSIQIDPIGATSLDALIGVYSPTPQNAGGICVISPGLPSEEWIALDEIVDDLTGIRLENVWRACADTNMKSHVAGERIWFIWTGGMGMGEETYLPDINVEMKFLPRSSNDAVVEGAAIALPIITVAGPDTSGRNSKPLHPIELSVNPFGSGGMFPQFVDMDELITQGSEAGNAGLECLPRQRAFNTAGILPSVMGLAFDGTGLNPSDISDLVLELEAWIMNLDDDPTGARGNAVAQYAIQGQSTNGDYFEFLKSDVLAAGVTGFGFNGRIEVEITHSPDGQFPNQKSYEPMQFDTVINGIFSVLPESSLWQSHFNGADLDTFAQDVSKYARRINFTAGAEIDTGQSVFGGSSLIVDNTVGGVFAPARREWDIRGNFTIEARLRFTSEATFPMLFEQWGTQDKGIQVYYNPGGNVWSANYSTTGASVATVNLHTGTWVPVLDTWYAIAVVRKGSTWSIYVDGTRLSAPVTQNNDYHRSTRDFVFGGGADGANFFDGNMDEMRLTSEAIYNLPTYVVAVAEFDDSRRNYPVLAHMDGTNLDVTYTDESLFKNVLLFGAATTFIASAQSMFGGTSLECGGTNGAGVAGDGVRVPYQRGQNLGKGNWTMEIFVRYRTLPAGNVDGYMLMSKYHRGNVALDWYWYVSATNTIVFGVTPTGGVTHQKAHSTPAQTIIIDTWYHFAAQRVGNDLELYFNGNRVAQIVDFFILTLGVAGPMNQPDNPGADIGIGTAHSTSSTTRYRGHDGWIDEPSLQHGVTRYNGSTYVVPVAPSADPNDSLTIPADEFGYLLRGDNGPDAFATDYALQTDDLRGAWLFFGGNAQMDDDVAGAFGPDNLSVRFDGNGDYVQTSPSESMYLDDDDFTIEARVYFTDDPDQNGGASMISQWFDSGNANGYNFAMYDRAGPPHSLEFHWSTDGANDFRVFTAFTPTLNTWYHLAVVRSGGSMFLFVDGVVQTNDGASDAITTDVIFNSDRVVVLGHANDAVGSMWMQGNMQNVAWTRSAKWVSGFTPPTDLYAAPTLPNV